MTKVFEASTVEEALALAANELGLSKEELKYKVVNEASKSFFGLGSTKPARIEVETSSSESISQGAAENTEAQESSEATDAGSNAAAEVTQEKQEDFNEVESEEEQVKLKPFRFKDVDPSELSDEQVDAIADTSIEVITKIAELCGAADFSIEEYEGEDGEIILDIVGPDLAFLIGRHGRTLEALHILNASIVNKKSGYRYPITVDVEGYRHRRKQKVVEIAQRAAERAKRQNRSVSLRPMTAQERRICHITVRDIPGVESFSEGSGNSRHVVIQLVRD